jgi:hypothetical protein
MLENNNIENIEIERDVEEVETIQPKKKQLSLKQLEHLNNIRIKALEKDGLMETKQKAMTVADNNVIEKPLNYDDHFL